MVEGITPQLEVPARVKLGDPLFVRFILTNQTTTDYYFLAWNTPLEDIRSRCLSVWKEGEPVPYDGRLVKRAPDPPPQEYILVPAGKKVEAQVDITKFFRVDSPGRYEIQVDTEVLDYTTKNPAIRTADEKATTESQELRTDRLEVIVEEGASPRLTIGEQARHEERVRAAEKNIKGVQAEFLGRVEIVGGTAAQGATARAAWQEASVMVHSARVAINSAGYNIWFGSPDNGRRERVDLNYRRINLSMADSGRGYPANIPPYRLNLTGEGCNTGDFAYWIVGTKTFWLCGSFWTAPATGINSQAGTIVHELSHAVVGTEDHAYGVSNCQNLASSNPDRAIDNADNYEYFAESVQRVTPGPYDSLSSPPLDASDESEYQR